MKASAMVRHACGQTYELVLNLETSRYGWVSCEGRVLAWFADLEAALASDIFEHLAPPAAKEASNP